MADGSDHLTFDEHRVGLVQSTDQELEQALSAADPMILRAILYQLTGDAKLLSMPTGLELNIRGRELQGLTDPADADYVRHSMTAFLKAHRDAGAPEIRIDDARFPRSMELVIGEPIPAVEFDMWREQTGVYPWARTFDWNDIGGKPSPEALADFKVVVIGAGLGGLNAAVTLKRAGIPYVLIEKNPEVGGTWFENRYPGARVDSSSRCYCFVFGAAYPFPYTYCTRDENFKHIRWIADTFDLRSDAKFETEVEAIVWDDAKRLWSITVSGPGGRETFTANAVISSVGLLNRPNVPKIEGMETFKGQAFHTARWPADLDHAGKRIALIGTGASGYQLAPEVARKAGHLYIFQRSPSWCIPTSGYLAPLAEDQYWLEKHVPLYANFDRLRQSWQGAPHKVAKLMHVDPDFQDPHARSASNKALRDACINFVTAKLQDKHPELIEKMIPVSPPMSTRWVLIDPGYSVFDALNQDNVSLVSDGIRRITPTGIETEDGQLHEVDIIVFATGYKVNEFLWPMEVRGRGGRKIEDLWAKDGARAYLGSMLPGFPNFFMIYGPNTNNFGGLQIVDIQELAARFAVSCIGGLIGEGKHTVEPTEDAYWRYNDEVDRAETKMLYSDWRVNTYYKNAHGRSAANNPIDFRRLWRWMRNAAAACLPPRPDFETRDDINPLFGKDLSVD